MAQSKKNSKTNRTGRTAKQKRMPRYEADSLAACLMVGILLLATGILTLLGAGFGLQHEVFRYLRQFSSSMFGSMTLLMTFALIAAGVALLISTTRKVSRRYVASYAILVVLLSGFVSLMTFVTSSEGQFPLLDYIAQKTGSDAFSGMMSRSMTYGMKGYGGGMVGMLLAWPLWKFFGAGLGAVILGLLMAVDVLVGGWSLFRRLYGWTGEKLVQLREKQAKRAEEAAAEEARRQEQERQRQLAEEQERIRQGNAANAAYTQNTPSPYARPGTEKGRVVSPYTQYPNAPVQPVMPQNPPVRKQPMPQGKPVQPVTSRKNNKIGFAPSAEELGQTGFADDWTTPRRKSAWSDSQPFTQPTYPMGQAAAEPPQIPTYEQPKQPAPSGVGEPATYSWNDMPAQPAPMQQTADAVPETEQNPPMMQWTQPTMPTQPTLAVDAPQETQEMQEEILPEAPEETPADLPEAVSADDAFDDDADFPAELDDRPPWEEPEDAPKKVLAPVLTQERPAGAWQPDLNLPAQPVSSGTTNVPVALQQPENVPAAVQPGIQVAKATTEAPSGGPSATGASATSTFNPEVPYTYPPMMLLRDPLGQQGVNAEEDELRTQRLEETLKSFRIPAKVRHITHGPAISRFELEIAPGIKVNKVTNLNHNIAMNMAVKSVRIEAPIPGKALVGVEVPNSTRTTVTLKEVLQSDVMHKAKGPLTVALGKDIAGAPILCNLAKMPHLLIAGATGSGKSVCINTIINSLLYRCSPKEVRMILVDPKVVELQCYNGIPHLLIPVVTDPKKAAGALNWAVGEMERRYKLFADHQVRNLVGYNDLMRSEKAKAEQTEDGHPEQYQVLPQIVIVIDELADLMMVAGKEVEDYICRIAQKARAAGIHLIVATQRPSVDVITGLIKANIPSRIAFAVSSQIDSRTILDSGGAEKLLGNGDMLFLPVGASKPVRVQGTFVTDEEIGAVLSFIKSTSTAQYDEEMIAEMERRAVAEKGSKKGGDDDGDGGGALDAMFEQAVECVIEAGQASTSLLQRRCKLGYARAARIMDQMEQEKIIGPYEGAKPRAVLVTKAEWEERKLNGQYDG